MIFPSSVAHLAIIKYYKNEEKSFNYFITYKWLLLEKKMFTVQSGIKSLVGDFTILKTAWLSAHVKNSALKLDGNYIMNE